MGWTSGSKNSDGSYSFSGGTQTGSSGSSSSATAYSGPGSDTFNKYYAPGGMFEQSQAYFESNSSSSPTTYGGYSEDIIRSTLQDIAAKAGISDLPSSVLNNFVNAILEDRQPLVNTAEARKSVELIQAIYKASNTKQIVNLEQP